MKLFKSTLQRDKWFLAFYIIWLGYCVFTVADTRFFWYKYALKSASGAFSLWEMRNVRQDIRNYKQSKIHVGEPVFLRTEAKVTTKVG